MLDVPVTNVGSSPHIYSRREFATRSLAMAFILLCHLWLFLIVLRPPPPWPWRLKPISAKDHALRIEWVPRPKRRTHTVATAPINPLPHFHAAPATTVIHGAIVTAATALPTATSPTLKLSIPAPATTPYGNSRFARALDGAQSTGLPPLPGANLISKVPGIHISSPPSLKNRLHALGKWLKCKDAIFKRRMSDEELIKRGLTHQQMDQKFAAECLP